LNTVDRRRPPEPQDTRLWWPATANGGKDCKSIPPQVSRRKKTHLHLFCQRISLHRIGTGGALELHRKKMQREHPPDGKRSRCRVVPGNYLNLLGPGGRRGVRSRWRLPLLQLLLLLRVPLN